MAYLPFICFLYSSDRLCVGKKNNECIKVDNALTAYIVSLRLHCLARLVSSIPRCCIGVYMSLHVSIMSCLLSFCLSKFSLQSLSVYLFIDEGAEDEVGPLHSGSWCGLATTGKRHKFLTPSISVSVPDDEPCNSDEEYYEHPLFSSEWTDSGMPVSATAQSPEALLDHDEGEQSMVPLSSSSPPPCHIHFIILTRVVRSESLP